MNTFHNKRVNMSRFACTTMIAGKDATEDELMHQVGYPEDWLKKTDFYQGPITYKKPEEEK